MSICNSTLAYLKGKPRSPASLVFTLSPRHWPSRGRLRISEVIYFLFQLLSRVAQQWLGPSLRYLRLDQ